MTTPTWDDLPAHIRHRIADHFQPTSPAEPVAGGFTPGVRVRILTATGGEVFIKAIPAHGPLADLYRTEAAINRLPDGLGPRLLTTMDTDGWVVLAFTYAEGRHPDLSPGSPDLSAVLDAVAALHTQLTPCPYPDAPEFTDHPVVERAATQHDAMRGDTLLHCDIRADNILIGEHGPLFVAWALAHRGAAWLDAALMVPQLILAGYTPEEAEKHAAQIPAYQDAPEEAVTAFAASITS
ncbi:aminoglycoside phosphotransferase [Streptomyces sp. NPDC093546]|uniref:aminoglycoside phosphotransferase n=1 Tax=Streptomyces sp. NPDC093546 TaxID=3366040 RepID=UPI00380424D0